MLFEALISSVKGFLTRLPYTVAHIIDTKYISLFNLIRFLLLFKIYVSELVYKL